MIEQNEALGAIVVMGLVTFALRALPFLAADWLQKHPLVHRLGRFMPLAIMTLLLLHSVVGAATQHAAGPWPEVLAVALVVGVQWYSRQALLSIVLGTGLYVLLRNVTLG